MDNQAARYERNTKAIRWSARIFGSLIVLFWLFVAFVSGITDPSEPETESIIMAILIVGTTIGILVAWKVERIGGLITLFFGIAHSIFALIESGHNHGFAMLISGGPFVLTGTLFLIANHRSRRGTPV